MRTWRRPARPLGLLCITLAALACTQSYTWSGVVRFTKHKLK